MVDCRERGTGGEGSGASAPLDGGITGAERGEAGSRTPCDKGNLGGGGGGTGPAGTASPGGGARA